jgi:hypothetical protein
MRKIKKLIFVVVKVIVLLGIGDWGLGIGDWAIPNPQSPIPNPHFCWVYKI